MDAPKCLPCLKLGKGGQMYKVAGKPNYLCRDCGSIKPHSSFEPIEFNWKADTDSWKQWILTKGIEINVS